jgi:hypothetical protein
MLLVIDLARVIVNIGWISLVIVVFILLYSLLLRRMKRGQITMDDYVELLPIEGDFAKGSIQFYFKNKAPKNIEFTIYNENNSFSKVIADELYQPGGHILKFDTTQIPNGRYYYEVKTENQKTSKLMEVRN